MRSKERRSGGMKDSGRRRCSSFAVGTDLGKQQRQTVLQRAKEEADGGNTLAAEAEPSSESSGMVGRTDGMKLGAHWKLEQQG